MEEIKIQGARIHNLKNINLAIPKHQLVVITGISGSGKSSLAFDILFEEGKNKYLRSIGILTGLDNEDRFDTMEGIGPTVAVCQNTIRQSNPRSTVGSKTGILNQLAMLYTSDGKAMDEHSGHLSLGFFLYTTADGMCFITSLLLAGAMLFVGYSYSIYVSTREYISNENPYDIMFVESNKYNSVNREDVINVVKDNGGSVNEYKELEYIEVPVFKEESGNLSVLNTRYSVISQSNYNKHMGININIKPNEALYVTVENESKDYKIPNLIFLTLKDNNLEIVDKLARKHGTLIEKEQFDDLVNESHSLKINADKIRKEKGVQFTNFRYGGEYDSGFAFILNDNDYNMIKKNVKEEAIKNLHLMNVRNKDVAFKGLLNYLKGVNDLDSTYWNEGQLWGGKISEDERGTLEAYRPLYREELIRMQLDDNGMLLFTTIFIGILFIITNGVVLYYKVISDVNEERKRNSILFKVGILENEVQSIIKKELRIIFFVPIFIGGMLGVYFLYIMVFNSGITELLMKKSFNTLLLGVLIQIIFYKISKNKYIKEVLN